jgi:hypothetical protein
MTKQQKEVKTKKMLQQVVLFRLVCLAVLSTPIYYRQ